MVTDTKFGSVLKIIQHVNSFRSRQRSRVFFSYLNSTEIYILVQPEIYLLFDRRPLEHIERYKYTLCPYVISEAHPAPHAAPRRILNSLETGP